MKVITFLGVVVAVVFAGPNFRARADTAVVPAEFANLPGDTPNLFPLFPGAGSPLRYQQVFRASDFPPGAIEITQIAFRPDSANTVPFNGAMPQIQISLSTTSSGVDALSTNFAGNLGSNVTVVYPMAPLP